MAAPPTAERDRSARVALIALLVVYAIWGLVYIQRTSFFVGGERAFSLWDDAMISMRYAKHLAEGDGLVWNLEGTPVQGYSNLGVTLLMAAIHCLPVDVLRVSLVVQLANLVWLLVVLVLVFDTTRRLFPESRVAAPAATALTAAYGPLAIWGLQGSDVVPVVLLLLLALRRVVVAVRSDADWPADVFVLLALGLVVRPDFAAIYAVFLGASIGLARRPVRTLAIGVALGLGTTVAIALFGALYYGDPLPNTYYLKATGHARSVVLAHGLLQTLELVGGASIGPLAAGAVGVAVLGRRDPLLWLPAALIVVLFAYDAWVGGDWNPQYVSRFVVPAVPSFFVLFAGCCDAAAREIVRRVAPARSRVAAPALGLVLASLGFLALHPSAPRAEWLDPREETFWHDYNRRNFAYGLYFRDRTDPETSLALHWAGSIAYVSDRHAVDVLGKSDPHIARLEVDRFVPGHSKWDWDYVLGVHAPDVFVSATRGLEHRPDFRADYYVVVNADGLRFFLRKASAERLHDPEVRVIDQESRRRIR